MHHPHGEIAGREGLLHGRKVTYVYSNNLQVLIILEVDKRRGYRVCAWWEGRRCFVRRWEGRRCFVRRWEDGRCWARVFLAHIDRGTHTLSLCEQLSNHIVAEESGRTCYYP